MGGGRDPGPVNPTQRGCSPSPQPLPPFSVSLCFSFCLSPFLFRSIQFCLFVFFSSLSVSPTYLCLFLCLCLCLLPSLSLSRPQPQDGHPYGPAPRQAGSLVPLGRKPRHSQRRGGRGAGRRLSLGPGWAPGRRKGGASSLPGLKCAERAPEALLAVACGVARLGGGCALPPPPNRRDLPPLNRFTFAQRPELKASRPAPNYPEVRGHL